MADNVGRIVRVDRTMELKYPAETQEVIYAELVGAGPVEYDVSEVDLWFHEDQRNGRKATGRIVFSHLREIGAIELCLSLHDALEIQKKGIAFYREAFGENMVYFWKSIVRFNDRRLRVPCLYATGRTVMRLWDSIDEPWNAHFVAARFKN